MLKNLSRMKHALMEWAIKERIFDDATFLTQKEWNDRGEKLHNDALMVLVIDGSGLTWRTSSVVSIETFGFLSRA